MKNQSSNSDNMQPVVPQQQDTEVVEEAEVASAAPMQYSSPVLGSSLDSSETLNPGAAQALYTGDTDSALAAQYGQAAQGGLMTLRR